jgi:hypothetical protein
MQELSGMRGPPRLPSIADLPLSDFDAKRFHGCEFIRPSMRRPQAKSSWCPAEDNRLINAIRGKEDIVWETVAAEVGQHTAKQCRERWLVKLNPDVRRSPFEKWEDDLIRKERQRIGNHWSLIAQLLPGRTACSVKNRWYTVLRYQQLMISGSGCWSSLSISPGLDSQATMA